jgi:hypothetical protein
VRGRRHNRILALLLLAAMLVAPAAMAGGWRCPDGMPCASGPSGCCPTRSSSAPAASAVATLSCCAPGAAGASCCHPPPCCAAHRGPTARHALRAPASCRCSLVSAVRSPAARTLPVAPLHLVAALPATPAVVLESRENRPPALALSLPAPVPLGASRGRAPPTG